MVELELDPLLESDEVLAGEELLELELALPPLLDPESALFAAPPEEA